MVICGSYMLGFGVSKDTKQKGYTKGGGNREGGGAIMSKTNYQRIEDCHSKKAGSALSCQIIN